MKPRVAGHVTWLWPVAALMLVGLGLRIAMGRGGLWLDEAWSVLMVRQVEPFLGVLSQIHHDNNHPLNSWWIQLVGPNAPVLLLRALSILSSTLTIGVAARFAARRSGLAAVATAAVFAFSPMLILIGSEARGYAPALLAQAWLIERLDPRRSLNGEPPPSPRGLLLAGLLGTLAHLLFFPALCLIAAWQILTGPGRLLRRAASTLRLLAPALIASLTVVAIILGSAHMAQGGLTVGNATPFSLAGWQRGVVGMLGMTLGSAWLVLPLLALLIAARPSTGDALLWGIVGLGLPLAGLLLQPPNVEFARYYLPGLFAVLTAAAISASTRPAGALLLAPILGIMAWKDVEIIRAARSEPDLPVRIAAAERGSSPTTMLLSSPRLAAPVTVAAERLHVPVTTRAPCGPAQYLLGDRGWAETAKPSVAFCGKQWILVATRAPAYRDGAGWSLYRVKR